MDDFPPPFDFGEKIICDESIFKIYCIGCFTTIHSYQMEILSHESGIDIHPQKRKIYHPPHEKFASKRGKHLVSLNRQYFRGKLAKINFILVCPIPKFAKVSKHLVN